jgi:hypothetical protein
MSLELDDDDFVYDMSNIIDYYWFNILFNTDNYYNMEDD